MLGHTHTINRHAKGEERHKLQLRRTDHAALSALLDKSEPPKPLAERIMENFAFFQDKLAEADLNVLIAGIKKLVAVQVSLLRGQDDPQLIFESLNSTGLALAQADLIRNFVLMRQEEHVQSKLYNDLWRPMEVEFDARYAPGKQRRCTGSPMIGFLPAQEIRGGRPGRRVF